MWLINTTNGAVSLFYDGQVEERTGIALSPDGGKLYLGDATLGTLTVLDTTTSPPKRTDIMLGNNVFPNAVAVGPGGGNIYVTDSSNNALLTIDADTHRVTATTQVGDTPIGVAVTPNNTKVYVANAFADTVSVIDVRNNAVIDTIVRNIYCGWLCQY